MEKTRELFLNIPDVVIITDAYGYVLDFNRRGPFDNLKKGKNIAYSFPDFPSEEKEIECNGKIYKPQVSSTLRAGKIAGYTVIFTDITEEESISKEIQNKNDELDLLTTNLRDGNEKLEVLAAKVKEISAYDEQLRIARSIHDDSGHAITEIYAICQMCLKLKENDIQKYHEMVREGINICKRALNKRETSEYESIRDIIDNIVITGQFPVEVSIDGEEPDFSKRLYPIIARIVEESYHNTIDHSLADKLFIKMNMNRDRIELCIQDNGKFRGPFEKGFGLLSMEDYVSKSGGNVRFIAKEGEGFGVVASWEAENER